MNFECTLKGVRKISVEFTGLGKFFKTVFKKVFYFFKNFYFLDICVNICHFDAVLKNFRRLLRAFLIPPVSIGKLKFFLCIQGVLKAISDMK